MTELVFKGQNDQVLTNSLYTDTTESYKDEDGSLVVIKKTVYSKRMLDIIVEMKGVLSNRPYFHTFMVSDDELDMLAALFPNNLFNDDKNNYFVNEVREIVSRFPKDFFTDEVMDMDIVIHISHRAAYTGSGRALWTLMGESKMDNIISYLQSVVSEKYIKILLQEFYTLKLIINWRDYFDIHDIISLFRQIDNSLNTLPKDKQYTYLVSDGRLYKIGKTSSIREEYMNAKHAKMQFENGYGISVLKGTLFYSNGIDTYEVAVLDNNGICYNTSITNDVIGYVDADEVSNIMKQIQELPPVVQ